MLKIWKLQTPENQVLQWELPLITGSVTRCALKYTQKKMVNSPSRPPLFPPKGRKSNCSPINLYLKKSIFWRTKQCTRWNWETLVCGKAFIPIAETGIILQTPAQSVVPYRDSMTRLWHKRKEKWASAQASTWCSHWAQLLTSVTTWPDLALRAKDDFWGITQFSLVQHFCRHVFGDLSSIQSSHIHSSRCSWKILVM